MQVHRLEDYRIHNRQGRSRGTGGYYVNRMGHKKETMVYSVYYETDAGEFSPEQWLEIMRESVANLLKVKQKRRKPYLRRRKMKARPERKSMM